MRSTKRGARVGGKAASAARKRRLNASSVKTTKARAAGRKKTTAKKPVAKKKTAAPKKPVARKTAPKKPVVRKPLAKKKAPAKKPLARKKTAPKKPVVRKPLAKKKALARKPVANKKVLARKPLAKKRALARKPLAKKKAPARKPVAKKKALATPARRSRVVGRAKSTRAVSKPRRLTPPRATGAKLAAQPPSPIAAKAPAAPAGAAARLFAVPAPAQPRPALVLHTADSQKPAPSVAPAQPEKHLSSVRVGRLPPRGDGSAAPPPELSRAPAAPAPAASAPSAAPTTFTPTAPRPAFEHETWERVDAVARELELPELSSDQRKAIRAALEGRDALVSMHAGLARTACFVVPSRLLRQPVLVVGPRPALMRELHDRLLQRRVPVVRYDGSLSDTGKRQALERIATGGSLVVLTTATTLLQDELPRALSHSGVSLVAVDDAHTATAATDETSPAALELGRALERLGRPPVLALLGATTPVARHEVIDALALRSPVHVETPLLRRNIVLDVLDVRGEARQRALVQLVLQLRRPGVIFAPTARDVDSIYGALSALRLPVHRFHAHMPPGDRVGEQLNFMLPGRRSIMVATSALVTPSGIVGVGEAALLDKAPADFGLCLEKKDLRFVLHWSAPASLEQYLREIALAGRDGEESTCVLFHDGSDRSRHESALAQSRIPSRHLMHLAKALEPAAIDGRPRTLEALALSSGLSRKLTETLAALLDDAGLVSLSSGWLRVTLPAQVMSAGAQRLAARLDRMRGQDGKRLSAVSSYADGSGCRSAALARYFGESGPESCGRCGGCKGSLLPSFDHESTAHDAHTRRAPVETFSLGQPDSYGIGVAAPARAVRPLTVKLADFQRGR